MSDRPGRPAQTSVKVPPRSKEKPSRISKTFRGAMETRNSHRLQFSPFPGLYSYWKMWLICYVNSFPAL